MLISLHYTAKPTCICALPSFLVLLCSYWLHLPSGSPRPVFLRTFFDDHPFSDVFTSCYLLTPFLTSISSILKKKCKIPTRRPCSHLPHKYICALRLLMGCVNSCIYLPTLYRHPFAIWLHSWHPT